jgi:AraC family transcriptional regulator
MDWIKTLQEAIGFMEQNLLLPITYEDAAKHLHMSNFHFHRMFSLASGMTANEYIRNRRLSLAGQELILSNVKVIDIAFKYGYDSPESFSRAFSRFHGTSPNMARQAGNDLKLFSRLIIKLTMEGGTIMDYRIENRGGIRLLAKVEQFQNEPVEGSFNNLVPEFWHRSTQEGVIKELCSIGNGGLYGICGPVSKESGYFDYGIAIEYSGSSVPEGFRIWNVDAGLWAVFKCTGDASKNIGETWQRIFSEFFPGSDYVMRDSADFEYYDDDEHPFYCDIWVPVEKKA